VHLTISFLVYVAISIFYYIYFSSLGFVESYYDVFTFAINGDYKKSFLLTIGALQDGVQGIAISNTTGIAYFYYYILSVFSIDEMVLSLIVNIMLFGLTLVYLAKTNIYLKISNKWLSLFLINPQIIFYTQAINKEAFTIFFYFLAIYLVVKRKFFFLAIFTLLFSIIRDYHFLYALMLVYLYESKTVQSFWRRLGLLYVAISLISVFFVTPMGLKDIGSISTLIYNLDSSYGVGLFLLAPVRIIQLFYDQFITSLSFINQYGLYSLYHIKDIIPNFIVIILIGSFLRKIRRFDWFYGPEKIYLISIASFLFVMMLNPIIHARYLIPVMLVILLVQTNKHDSGRNRIESPNHVQ